MTTPKDLSEVKERLYARYLEVCMEYWYSVLEKRYQDKAGYNGDYYAEKVMDGNEIRIAVRATLKASGLFTVEERDDIFNEAKERVEENFF